MDELRDVNNSAVSIIVISPKYIIKKALSVLTAVIVQHVRQELVGTIEVIVDWKDVLWQWISMQTENNEMEQLSELVRQIAEQVVTQMKLSEKVQESYSIEV